MTRLDPKRIPVILLFLTFSFGVDAAEHRLEELKDGKPTDQLSKEVADLIADNGIKVLRGAKRTVCEIWPCKKWDRRPDFEPTTEVHYPFTPGQLVGVIRFRRKTGDFRDQQLSRGVYTLRYGQQPVDGNHEGTSPTRDFLLLVKAEDDKSVEPLGEEQLMKASADAAGTSHPAMLWLRRNMKTEGDVPSLIHDAQKDWWILRMSDNDVQDRLVINLVVVGHAEE